MKKTVLFISVAFCLILLSTTAFAEETILKSRGQTVWLPAAYYIKFYTNDKEENVIITNTSAASIVNLDLNNSITLKSVRLLLNGDLELPLKEYVDPGPIVLGPLEAKHFITNVPSLGFDHFPWPSPNPGDPWDHLCFIIEWETVTKVTTPAISVIVVFHLHDDAQNPGNFRKLSAVTYEGKVINELK